MFGYLEETDIEQGTGGPAFEQSSTTYFLHSNGAAVDPATVAVVATQTDYPNGDGSLDGDSSGTDADPRMTSYGYVWYGDSGTPPPNSTPTVQPYMISTTLPTATEDGSDATPPVSYTVDDPYGNVVWTMDADGYIDYTAYDPATDAETESISNVTTTAHYVSTCLPSSWTIPSSGTIAVTTMQVDALGRTIEETDPDGNVTYTVYNDPAHEVRTYAGWNSSTNRPTGPTQVTIDNEATGITDTITMSEPPAVRNGMPTGTESIADLDSLSRSLTNTGGQQTATEDYVAVAGLCYTNCLGCNGGNYVTTTYGYNADGVQDRVQEPATSSTTPGQITDTVIDGLGRTVSTWEGTNDSGATNNMVETTADTYDNGGGGDSNLTQEIDYASSSSEDITDNFYDWRDRLIITAVGVPASGSPTDQTITVNTLDNDGEQVATSEYNGDDITVASINSNYVNGVPTIPSGDACYLRQYSTAAFDDQGQDFEEETYTVDQTTGGSLALP